MTNALRTFNVGTATVRVHVEKDQTAGQFAVATALATFNSSAAA